MTVQAGIQVDEAEIRRTLAHIYEPGDVIEFVDPIIEQRQRALADEHGFELVDHSLVLYVRKK